MNSLIFSVAAMLAFPLDAFAQHAILAQAAAPAQAATPAPAQKSLSQQWGLYVFAAKKQTKETQDKDEYDCYQWAKQTSGIDPLAHLPRKPRRRRRHRLLNRRRQSAAEPSGGPRAAPQPARPSAPSPETRERARRSARPPEE